jgi:hypothetical protein
MYRSLRTFVCTWTLAAFFAASASGENPRFSETYPPLSSFAQKSLSGFELELRPPQFAVILPFFDLHAFQEQVPEILNAIPERLINRYPTYPQALAELPEPFHGLLVAASKKSQGALLSEWKKIPISHRRKLLQLEHLPREALAKALIDSGVLLEKLPLKNASKLDPAIHKLFSRLSWSRDLGKFELRNPVPNSDPEETIRMLKQLGGFGRNPRPPRNESPSSKQHQRCGRSQTEYSQDQDDQNY